MEWIKICHQLTDSVKLTNRKLSYHWQTARRD